MIRLKIVGAGPTRALNRISPTPVPSKPNNKGINPTTHVHASVSVKNRSNGLSLFLIFAILSFSISIDSSFHFLLVLYAFRLEITRIMFTENEHEREVYIS